MIAMTGSIGAPSSMSLTPGRRRPSWKSSFASLEIEPGDHAADVVPVRDVRRPRDELAGREDGQREDHVVEVRDAAVVRVVRDEDVARAELAPAAVQLDDPLHRLVEAADEGGNARARGREIPVRVGDARAHVEHLVDDRAHRRPAHGAEHLVARRLQRALDDLQRDLVRSRGADRPGRHDWASGSAAGCAAGASAEIVLRRSGMLARARSSV